jgi:hypothetical protein
LLVREGSSGMKIWRIGDCAWLSRPTVGVFGHVAAISQSTGMPARARSVVAASRAGSAQQTSLDPRREHWFGGEHAVENSASS